MFETNMQCYLQSMATDSLGHWRSRKAKGLSRPPTRAEQIVGMGDVGWAQQTPDPLSTGRWNSVSRVLDKRQQGWCPSRNDVQAGAQEQAGEEVGMGRPIRKEVTFNS